MGEPVRMLLMAVVLPLWIAAGFADWACHRATHIAATSGLRENLLHWLMFVQMGVAVLAFTLLQVNALVLLVVLGAFVLHEATVWWDLRYTVPRREVRPVEQMVHSLQEVLPLTALLLLAADHWDQALALVGRGQPDWALRWKEQPWPLPVLLGGAAAVALLNVLPLAQETLACLRVRRRTPPSPAPR